MRHGSVADRNARHERRRLQGHLGAGLRYRSVADVANLAVIFVVGVRVRMADGVRRQHRERQYQHDG